MFLSKGKNRAGGEGKERNGIVSKQFGSDALNSVLIPS